MSYDPQGFVYTEPGWLPLAATMPQQAEPGLKVLGGGDRYYQVKCFKKFAGEDRTILISPTGSGKTTIMIYCAAREILTKGRRQLFSVPQNVISCGFADLAKKQIRINGRNYHWGISDQWNCCTRVQSVKRLREFMLRPNKPGKKWRSNFIGGNDVAIATHAAVVAVWKTLTPAQKKIAVKNVTFRIDETHHVSGVGDDLQMNHLGKFVKDVLDYNGRLHLATATFFRGDRIVLLSEANAARFVIYRVDFMDHWKTLRLRELRMDYKCYSGGGDLLQQVINGVAAEPNEPALVVVPADGQGFFRNVNKPQWVAKLVASLEAKYGEGSVLDLVSPDRQKADYIRFGKQPQEFRVVVTCSIGREGADWPACSRVHNLVLDGNVLMLVQKLGRALRPYEAKVDVVMTNYIEEFKGWKHAREKLSDRFNAVVAASMLDEMMFTILMPTVDKKGQPSQKVGLADVFGSEWPHLILDLVERYHGTANADQMTGEMLTAIIDDVIDDYRDDMLLEVADEDLRMRLRKEILRRTHASDPKMKIDGFMIEFVRTEGGWDRVTSQHIAGRTMFVGAADTVAFNRLRKILNTDGDWHENMTAIKKHGGFPALRKKHDTPELLRLYHWALRKRAEMREEAMANGYL